MKSLAATMLVLWVLCWAHCTLSRYGAVIGNGACACCEASHADHEEVSHGAEPCHDEAVCAICDFLSNGATLTQKVSPMLPLEAAALLQIWESVRLPVVASATFTVAVPHDPPPLRPLCELLSRTACPVRGPTLNAI